MAGNRDLSAKFSASTADFEQGVARLRQTITTLNAKLAENKDHVKATGDELRELEKERVRLEGLRELKLFSRDDAKDLEYINKQIAESTNRLHGLKAQQSELKAQTSLAEKELKLQYASLTQVGGEALKTGDIIKANLISEAIIGGLKKASSAMASLVKGSASAADELNTLSMKYGISTEELQKFQYASDRIDVSVETLTSTMTRSTRSMDEYRKGTADTVEAYDALGVAVLDGNNELRDSRTVYFEVVEALRSVENATERDTLSMRLFGRSAQEITPLILGGADALVELSAEAESLGLILSQEQVDHLHEFNDKLDGTKANFKALGMVVAEEFAGSFDSVFGKGDEFVQFVQELKDDGTLREMAETTAVAITGIVDVLEAAIRVGWEYKEVVAVGAAALVVFNTAVKAVNGVAAASGAIKKLTDAVKSSKAATEAATVATKAHNAALTASPVAMTAALGTLLALTAAVVIFNTEAGKSTELTLDDVQAGLDKARATKAELEELKRLTSEYERLGSKTSLTADEKSTLAELQERLNEKYGTEAAQLDLVNGKYSEQIQLLESLSEEELKAARREARITQNQAKKLYDQRISDATNPFGNFENAGEAYEEWAAVLERMEESGSTDDWFYKNAHENFKKYEEIVNSYTEATEWLEYLQSELGGATGKTENSFVELSGAVQDVTQTTKELSAEMKVLSSAFSEQAQNGKLSVESALDLIDAGYQSILVIDEETGAVKLSAEAYKGLAEAKLEAKRAELELERSRAARRYSEVDFSSAHYLPREIKAEIDDINLQIALIEELQNNLDAVVYGSKSNSGANNELKQYQEYFISASNERIAQLTVEQQAQKKLHDDTIKAIDEEIRKRKELNEDLGIADRLDAVNAQLKYDAELDEFSRGQLEKQREDLLSERDELLWQREKTEEKSSASVSYQDYYDNEYKAAVSGLNAAVDSVKQMVSDVTSGLATVSQVVNNEYAGGTSNPVFNFNSTQFTEEQLVSLFKRALSSSKTLLLS